MFTKKLILVRNGEPENFRNMTDPGLHFRAGKVLQRTVEIIGNEIDKVDVTRGVLIASSEQRKARETATQIASGIASRGLLCEVYPMELLNSGSKLERYSRGVDLDAGYARLSAYLEILREINEQPHAVDSEAAVIVTHAPVIAAMSKVVEPTIMDLSYGGVTVVDLNS